MMVEHEGQIIAMAGGIRQGWLPSLLQLDPEGLLQDWGTVNVMKLLSDPYSSRIALWELVGGLI